MDRIDFPADEDLEQAQQRAAIRGGEDFNSLKNESFRHQLNALAHRRQLVLETSDLSVRDHHVLGLEFHPSDTHGWVTPR